MATEQPQQPTDSVMLQGFKGLKNTVTAERLDGQDLARARNVDLDDAGQIRRRRGYTVVAAGNYHSLWTANDGTVYGVKNGALGIIRPNFSFETLKPQAGPDPIAYVQVADEVFFSSLSVSGIIRDGTVSDWGAQVSPGEWHSPVVMPTTTLPDIEGKLLGKPPHATALAYHNGRIYLANGRTLWATELYLYRYVDKTRTYLQFESDITALGTVTDGIYVGTEDRVYFMSGPLSAMQRIQVLDSGALPRSMINISADVIRENPSATRSAVVFMTSDDAYVGQDNGMVYGLTSGVTFPEATAVAPMYRNQDGIHQYVAVTDTGGSPVSSARIGDYVDAEIRRFQGA
jgi:hypothetical protein